MSRRLILDNENNRLWFYPEAGIVHHQINRYIFGDMLRESLIEGTKLIEMHGAGKWLSDYRRNSAIPEDDVQWCITDWHPRATAAGWKHWAVVVPEKAVGKMKTRRLIDHAEKAGLNVRSFTDPEEALSWLKSV